MEEKIIKKEGGIQYTWRSGALVLTTEHLFLDADPLWFTSNHIPINIPIQDIINIRAHKPNLAYQDQLIVTFIDKKGNGKEKTVTFIKSQTWKYWTNGRLARLEENFFMPWVSIIEDIRKRVF